MKDKSGRDGFDSTKVTRDILSESSKMMGKYRVLTENITKRWI